MQGLFVYYTIFEMAQIKKVMHLVVQVFLEIHSNSMGVIINFCGGAMAQKVYDDG